MVNTNRISRWRKRLLNFCLFCAFNGILWIVLPWFYWILQLKGRRQPRVCVGEVGHCLHPIQDVVPQMSYTVFPLSLPDSSAKAKRSTGTLGRGTGRWGGNPFLYSLVGRPVNPALLQPFSQAQVWQLEQEIPWSPKQSLQAAARPWPPCHGGRAATGDRDLTSRAPLFLLSANIYCVQLLV